MLGLRTPVKSSQAEEDQQPSETSQTIPQGSEGTTLNTTVDIAGSPSLKTPKFKGRVNEAKSCVMKAKLQLKNSRNLKAEIKTIVTEALERLYQLVKEAEAAKPSIPSTAAVDSCCEHGRLIKKSLEDTAAIRIELKQQSEWMTATALNVGAVMEHTAQMKTTMDQHSERMTAVALDVGAVKDSMSHIKTTLDQYKVLDGVSYAAMAAVKKPKEYATTKPQSVHSVVVSSADAHDTSEDVINKIRTAVSARTSGIRVDRLRKARDQKVVLGCQSREEMTKVMDKLKADSPTLHIQQMENRDPLIIMFNVLNINTDEEVLSALKRQNSHILGLIPEKDYRASVKFRRKARNPLESHVVLQVSPQVWNHLTEEGRAHIDLQRVVVKDQSPLVTCSRCLGYGHGRKTCQESVDTCSHCAGTHLRNACPALKAGEKPTCRNCQNARLDRTDHNSFDGECPIRRKWDALARSKVAYC